MTDRGRDPDHAVITDYVDAAAPGLGPADFVIVFGTRFSAPAPIAASTYQSGLSRTIVLTGGANEQEPGIIEADVHRRAVLLLARNIPSLRRILTVTYDPPDPDTGQPVTRDSWPELDAGRVHREFDVIHDMLRERGVDALAADGYGWTRTRPPEPAGRLRP